MAPVIPSALLLLLPFIITPLAGWLNHDTLPSWANSLIVAVLLLGLSTLSALFSNKLTGSLVDTIMLIAAYSGALMNSPALAPLQKWLTVNAPSPLARFAPVPPSGEKAPGKDPQPLVFPPSPTSPPTRGADTNPLPTPRNQAPPPAS